jgi:uncharacterized protein involved in exopolysaccharide biosynthesis
MALTPSLRTGRYPVTTNPFGDGLSRGWTLADIRAALVRRSRVLLIACAALSAGAIAAVLTAPVIHEGTFKILVKRDRADAVVSGAAADSVRAEELSESELGSQVELLKAQDLREQVATESGLTKRLMTTGEAETDQEAMALALHALDRDLSVTPIRKTWLIDVTYRDQDPQVARKVLDTMVQAYFEKHLTLHRPSGTFEFFSEQVARARQELEAAQHALVEFSRRAGVVSADAEKQALLAKLAEFDGMRAEARSALAEASGRQAAASAELKRVPATRAAQTRITQNAGAAQEIQSKIVALELRRTELLQRFTPEYRGVTEIEEQLKDAKATLAAALGTTLREETVADNPTRQWLDTELVRARTDNAALEARVHSLSSAVNQFRTQAQRLEVQSAEQNDLARKLAAAEDRYRLYLAKQEEARISDELDKTRIANVAIAQAPALKHEPLRRPSLAMLPLLLVVSLILGAALALAVEAFSGSPRASSVGVMPVGDDHPLDERLAAMTRVTVARSDSFSSRIAELQKLTETVSAKWTDEKPAPRRADDDNNGWVPNADGLRQGA